MNRHYNFAPLTSELTPEEKASLGRNSIDRIAFKKTALLCVGVFGAGVVVNILGNTVISLNGASFTGSSALSGMGSLLIMVAVLALIVAGGLYGIRLEKNVVYYCPDLLMQTKLSIGMMSPRLV